VHALWVSTTCAAWRHRCDNPNCSAHAKESRLVDELIEVVRAEERTDAELRLAGVPIEHLGRQSETRDSSHPSIAAKHNVMVKWSPWALQSGKWPPEQEALVDDLIAAVRAEERTDTELRLAGIPLEHLRCYPRG